MGDFSFSGRTRLVSDLFQLPLGRGRSRPVRAAYDYQNETNDEQCCEGCVVQQTIDSQERGAHDEEETCDSCEFAERSHKGSDSTTYCK